ncbi:probable serine/threonine-protein kinase DDB_G0282963 isoform X2 [Panonychus citri]|uniref:probable serine/threonine-protein kinase DDB_G0282963 isoform X2 n=1 Tax=Panonychus citri TaxID=50023 RepID=UPI002307F2E5|nr:probable serine/threonine-protein kinase DDB_G0282963 isoform X2 [Panonychus citri]
MLRSINLSNFSDDECKRIISVIQRDAQLHANNQDKIRNLLFQSCHWLCKSQLNHFGSAKSTVTLPSFKDKIESGYESMSTGNDVDTLSNLNTVTSMNTPNQRQEHGIVLDDCDEEVLIKVRENIETLIEGFIGSSLDQAHVNKPYIHDKYDRILDEYQTPLAQAILDLTEALFLSLQNQPFVNGNIPTNAHSHLKKLIHHLNHITGQLPKLPVHLESSASLSSTLDESQTYEDLLAIAIINELIKVNQERNYYSSSSSSSSSLPLETNGETRQSKLNVHSNGSVNEDDKYHHQNCPSTVSISSNGSASSMNHSSRIKANGINHHSNHHESVNEHEHDDDDDEDNRMIYHRSEVFPETRSSVTISDKTANGDVDDSESDVGHHHQHHNQQHPQHEPVSIVDIIKDRETAYKIEEQIEEITTSTIAADGDEDGECIEPAGGSVGADSVDSGESERRRQVVDSVLDPYGLDLSSRGCARVAFPEFGLDIMDLNYAENAKDYADHDDQFYGGDGVEHPENQTTEKMNDNRDNGKVKVVDAFSWEENWLFQKKRKSETDVVPIYCLLNLSESTDPVCMLIPNPSQFVPPQIGSTSIDQLSDLTERNSVGSLEFSSSEDEDEDLEGETVNQIDSINHKTNIINKLQVNSSTSSSSSSPLPASTSSLSSSSYTVNKKLQQSTTKSNLNKSITANQHSSSSPLPPLKIPEFIPNNKRPSSSSTNHVHHLSNSPSSSSSYPSPSSSNELYTELSDPMFTLSPQPANVQSDILVQFCCRVKGSQPLGVAWYRNGIYIGGTIEKGKCRNDHHIQHGDSGETECDKSLLNVMKIDVDTKDFRTFKHFTDHILEIKSTRVDLSGTYSTCVYNHVNQHWIDFKVTINAKNDYHQQKHQPKPMIKNRSHHQPSASYQKNVLSPPPIKQRSTKSTCKNDTNNSPKVLSEKLHSHHHEDEIDSSVPHPGIIAEREHRKWEESTVIWPDNPYTIENVTKRKQYLDSLEPTATSPIDKIEDDEANLHALPYISPSKDMGRYKRDYYVPNVPKEHETCNGVDEKVYSSSKYFSPSISPTNLSEDSGANVINHQAPSQAVSSSSCSPLIPTVTVTSCSSTSSSPLPVSRSSGLSSSSSSTPGLPRIVNEHHLHYKHAEAQVLENLGNITSLVSVKELINRFSDLNESNSSTNGQYLRGLNDHHNYGNSLNRDGTMINGGTGIKPRLITDKHHYQVPFKLSCWHDDDDDDTELKDETNDKIINDNHQQHNSSYHDENDNNVDQDNLNDYYERNDKINWQHNNNNDNNNHGNQMNRKCDDNHHDQDASSYGLDYYQRSNSEASLSTLMSPPPPILPPRVQPRLSTTNNNNVNPVKSNRAKFNPIKPQHPLAVNSITGRCLNKEYRNWANKNHQSNPSSSSTNLMGSLSLYDINQVSSAEISNKSENPESPSNEGNLSDRIGDGGKQSTPFGGKKHVRRMAPSIMKRASFWEKKCEQEMPTT